MQQEYGKSSSNSVAPDVTIDHCAICGSSTAVRHPVVKDFLFSLDGSWRIVQCQNSACRHAQLSPMPSDAELRDYYSQYITHESAEVGDVGRQDLISKYLKAQPGHRARELLFLDHTSPGTLLEVGCGNGVNLLKLQREGWVVQGQDLDPAAAAQARSRGIDVKLGFLQDVRSELGSYRAVIMVHVIEHLRTPVNDLKIFRQHLDGNGDFVIITPNIRSLPHRIFGRYWAPLHAPFHLHHFSRASLERAAGDAGLTVKQCFTHSSHAASNIRASLQFLAQDKTGWASLLRLPSVAKLLEAALFALLGIAQVLTKDAGDECVLICQSARM